jgi:hypothetical protein
MVWENFTKDDKSIIMWVLVAIAIYLIYIQEFVFGVVVLLLWLFLRFYWKSYFKKDSK